MPSYLSLHDVIKVYLYIRSDEKDPGNVRSILSE